MGQFFATFSNLLLSMSDTSTGKVGVTLGGTGLSSLSTGDMLYASASNTLSKLAGNGTSTRKALTSLFNVPTWTDFAADNLNDSVSLPRVSADNIFTGQNTFAAGTITASKPLTITQTWNNAGVSFNSLLVNVTDTASTSGSTLFDFQVSGSSKGYLTKNGKLVLANNIELTGSILKASASATLDFQNQNSSTANLTSVRLASATFTQSSGAMTCLSIAPTYNQSGTAGSTDLLINRTNTALGSGTHNFIELQNAGSQKFYIQADGNAGSFRSYGTGRIDLGLGIGAAAISNTLLNLSGSGTSANAIKSTCTNTASSGTPTLGLWLLNTYNQTSTAGSTDLMIVRTETALGSGTHRLIDCYAGAAGTTNVFYVSNAGSLFATGNVQANGNFYTAGFIQRTTASGTLDIQNLTSSTANLVQTRFANATFSQSSGTMTAVAITPTINQSGSATGYTALKIAATETAVLGTNRLIDCYAGAAGTTAIWSVGNDGHQRFSTDTGLARSAAGVVKVTDASTGRGDLECEYLRTPQIADRSLYTVTGTASYLVKVKDTSGNIYWIDAYQNSQVAAV